MSTKNTNAGSDNTNSECQTEQETAKGIEAARLNRRQALRRLGFTAGAAFGMMAIGDVARFVQQQMDMTDRSKTVADRLVDQFAKSDVAQAVMVLPVDRCLHAAETAYEICKERNGPGGVPVCYSNYNASVQQCHDMYPA